jgi:hypothetical protein
MQLAEQPGGMLSVDEATIEKRYEYCVNKTYIRECEMLSPSGLEILHGVNSGG